MKLIKSLVITVAALCSTAVLAEDGSERAGQASQQMRLAVEQRQQDQANNQADTLISADEKKRVEPASEG